MAGLGIVGTSVAAALRGQDAEPLELALLDLSRATQAQLNEGTLPRCPPSSWTTPTPRRLARYWVDEAEVRDAVPETWDREWLLGWRDITNASNVRTFVPERAAAVSGGPQVPSCVAIGTPELRCRFCKRCGPVFGLRLRCSAEAERHRDDLLRREAAGHALTRQRLTRRRRGAASRLSRFCRSRVLGARLHRQSPWRRTQSTCSKARPARLIPGRRSAGSRSDEPNCRRSSTRRCCTSTGSDRDDAEHVLDSFFVLRKYEERDHGEFRTKRLVLAAYDAMTQAAETGVPFESPLDPPPGQGPRHPERDQ